MQRLHREYQAFMILCRGHNLMIYSCLFGIGIELWDSLAAYTAWGDSCEE